MPLALSDQELAIITEVGQAIPEQQRAAFFRSVVITLAQCSSRNESLVRRVSVEEKQRLLELPSKWRPKRFSARYAGYA